MKSGRETYAHLLQRLGQDVASFLLVDKDDDGRLEAVRQHLQQLLPAMHKSNAHVITTTTTETTNNNDSRLVLLSEEKNFIQGCFQAG